MVTTPSTILGRKTYARDYVIDYTSFENDNLMVFAEGNGQLEYEQKHVYAGSERIEQFTDKGNWERTLYVHEDVMGNTRYYTKSNGQSFAELTYDAWGMPESPNKLLNNDHGNYVSATFTGHIYDTTLDIYFAEARFYDANNRTWLAMDPIKDGGNWYQYCSSNPTTYWDPTGLWGMVTTTKQALLAGSEIEPALFWRQRDFFNGNWWQNEDDLTIAYEMLLKESKSRNMTIITLAMDYNYFDYFGYANTRIYTLQALIGEGRTGVYDSATMTTLRNVLLTQYADFDFDDPELTQDTLEAIRNWYDNSSELGKKGTYIWENGWGNIISGVLLMGAGYINGPVETPRASEEAKYGDQLEVSDQKMYQQGQHYNRHGRDMGYGSKKAYEAGARDFIEYNRVTADIFEGTWNSPNGVQAGETQIIMRASGKQVIINKTSGQIIDFYEGTSLNGFINIRKVQ